MRQSESIKSCHESIHAVRYGVLTEDMQIEGRLETHIGLGALTYSKITILN